MPVWVLRGIGVASGTLDDRAKAMRDALDGDASEVVPLALTSRDRGGDDVSGAEAEVSFGLGEIAARESVLGQTGALVGAAANASKGYALDPSSATITLFSTFR